VAGGEEARELARNSSLTTFATAIITKVEMKKGLKFILKGTMFYDMEKQAAARLIGVKI
jgi:hypothetical protein